MRLPIEPSGGHRQTDRQSGAKDLTPQSLQECCLGKSEEPPVMKELSNVVIQRRNSYNSKFKVKTQVQSLFISHKT